MCIFFCFVGFLMSTIKKNCFRSRYRTRVVFFNFFYCSANWFLERAIYSADPKLTESNNWWVWPPTPTTSLFLSYISLCLSLTSPPHLIPLFSTFSPPVELGSLYWFPATSSTGSRDVQHPHTPLFMALQSLRPMCYADQSDIVIPTVHSARR